MTEHLGSIKWVYVLEWFVHVPRGEEVVRLEKTAIFDTPHAALAYGVGFPAFLESSIIAMPLRDMDFVNRVHGDLSQPKPTVKATP